MKWLSFLNAALTLACLIHVISLLNGYLNPVNTSVKHFEKKLKDISFPINIKLCLEQDNQIEMLKELGYQDTWYFYAGQSKYNSNVVGWNGHTQSGIIGSAKGKRY